MDEQRLLRRHGRALLVLAAAHALLVLALWRPGRVEGRPLCVLGLLLALAIWSLGYYRLISAGHTLRCTEPSCSLPMGLGMVALFLVTAFALDEERLRGMLLFFPLLLLVSFRVGRRALLWLALMASLGYGAMLTLVVLIEGHLDNRRLELLQWLVFTLVAGGGALSGGRVNRLRYSLALKNRTLAAALEQVRDLAIRDDLTGLFNRRHIMEVLAHQKVLADHQPYQFAVCYLDLDRFKRINDEFGHRWGDQVLKRFARLARDNLRDGDYCARLGGEEFILLLPESDPKGAFGVAERLRQRWSEHDFRRQGGPPAVSLSAGVATYRRGETLDQLLNRADHALYLAKSNGRNRVWG